MVELQTNPSDEKTEQDPSEGLKTNSEPKAKKGGHSGRVVPSESLTVPPSSYGHGNPMAAPGPGNQSGTMVPSPNSKSTMSQGWNASARSDSMDGSCAPLRPHTGGDVRWDAITSSSSKDSPLGLTNFRLLKRLGYGDIGSVYLVELRGTSAFFAMKVMDKSSLASRNKLLRAQTEREILGLLDHPFLPTLYTYFETEKFYCLVMEFCSGGNLHSLRQKQPAKHFTEEASRLCFNFLLYMLSIKMCIGKLVFVQILRIRGVVGARVSAYAGNRLQGPKAGECACERRGPHHAIRL